MSVTVSRQIAHTLLNQESGKLRKLPYADFLRSINKAATANVTGPDGKTYRVENQAFWDSKKGGNIRVMVCVDDGGWSVLKPLSASFIITPDGSFVGE
jgi:hypothetical protein